MHCKMYDAMNTKVGSNLLARGDVPFRIFNTKSTVKENGTPTPPLSSSTITTQNMPVPESSLSITFRGDGASIWKAIAVQNEKLKHWIISGS